MNRLPTNICPLHGNPCIGNRCAWWDCGGNECAMTTAAFAIREVAENLEDLNSQALTNLQKKEE